MGSAWWHAKEIEGWDGMSVHTDAVRRKSSRCSDQTNTHMRIQKINTKYKSLIIRSQIVK
jgi:hypothetical protein